MRLDTEFIRLPLRVDATRLAREVERIPEAAWRPHPQRYAGNSAIALVSVDGDFNSDEVVGAMRPTPHLSTCPYLKQVLHALSAVIGRTRLMRLDGNAEAISHSDINYYWFERARVHVPIVTHANVTFHCGRRTQHMAAGEVWIFDTWQPHRVINPQPTRRIHLVADTVGSAAFWAMVDAGDRVFAADRRSPGPDREISYDAGARPALPCESWNAPAIMPAAQLAAIVEQIRAALPARNEQAAALDHTLVAFAREWRGLWARYGAAHGGRAAHRQLCERLGSELDASGAGLQLDTGADAQRTVRELLLRPALAESAPDEHEAPRSSSVPPGQNTTAAAPARRQAARVSSFDRPIFIVCPPRSGSSMLFEAVSQSPNVWTIGGEAHHAIEGIPELHPASSGYDSNRLGPEAASESVVERLQAALWQRLRNRHGATPEVADCVRLLEKTPKNSLRVPFLASAFPDACFIYLYRDPREVLSSMLDAWRSGRFVTYPELPSWQGPLWSLLLTPGWRELSGRPLHEIVAHQWTMATELLLDDLEALAPEAWCVAAYDRLVDDPRAEIERICAFVKVRWDRPLGAALPISRTALTSPDPEKWRMNASELAEMMPVAREVAARAHQLFGRPPATRPASGRSPARRPSTGRPPPADPSRHAGPAPAEPQPGGSVRPSPSAAEAPALDFRSVYTPGFPQLLRQLCATLVVTTYQSGRVILVRADDSGLNTHLRSFASPMGVAIARGRLALGTQTEIWEFFDMPLAAAKLDGPAKHDAVYVPRSCSVTGDIRVHELAYAGGELWITNTRFSALCTLDRQHSFVPRWRPPFVTALAPDDRCHLNGLCVVNDRVRFVTAFGATDAAGGWRAGRAAGGCILEVPSGRVIAAGLSMPHSPRWHEGALWVLESGKGEIGVVDFETRSIRPRAQLNGFTRGLALAGPYAFVGLSQVRESQVFGGVPLLDRVRQRQCGVWVVDVRTGETAAFLRFEGTVQEIFDVQLLTGARFAELLEPASDLLGTTYALPPDALAELPTQLKSGASKK